MSSFPGHCEKTCGLCEIAQVYKIYPEKDQRNEAQGKPKLLVLGAHPHPDDDRVGVPFYSKDSGGVLLRDYLNSGDFQWVISHLVRCFPGMKADGKRANPTAKQMRTCIQNELPALLDQVKPAAIVVLGEHAMRGLLGSNAPKSLARAIGNTFLYVHGETAIPVLCGYDPSVQILWEKEADGGKNLAAHYDKLFTKAEKVVVEGAPHKQYPYTLIDSPVTFMKLSQKLGKVISFDWEYAATIAIPGMQTYWHEDSYGVCVVVTDHDPKVPGEFRNYIIHPRLIRRKDIWQAVLAGRHWRGQNIKVEFQCFWIYCGFCVYDLLPKDLKYNGEYVIHDTMLWCFAQDHGMFGIGLKPQAMEHRGVEDWSLPADREMEEQRQRIHLDHSIIQKQMTASRRLMFSSKFSREEKAVARERYRELKIAKAELRPENSQHYGDLSDGTVFTYNAGDGENTHWLGDFQVAQGWEPAWPLNELQQRALFVTTKVEREGLPIVENRVLRLQNRLKTKKQFYTAKILKDPRVKALMKSSVVLGRAKYERKLRRSVLYKEMSPMKNQFLVALAQALGDMEKVPFKLQRHKKTGELRKSYVFDEQVLIDLCGGEEDCEPQHRKPSWTKWDDKTVEQKIWAHIYALRQVAGLINKVAEYKRYMTPDGRVRPDFRLAKVDADSGDDQDKAGGTSTGRLSASRINSTQIKKDNFLRWIFSSEVYGPDWLLVEADCDRGEPVCLAVIANIKIWKEVFRKGWDLYQVIANDIYNLGISLEGDPDEVKKRLEKVPEELRENAKTRTLAIMYGESAKAFAYRANIPLQEAIDFYKKFDKLYPEITKYKKHIEWIMRNERKVISPFGRPRDFTPRIARRSRNYSFQFSKNHLQAVNFPVQSKLSDIVLWKAYEVYRWLEAQGLLDKVKIINLVHDALWIAMHESVAPEVLVKIKEILEDTSTLPLKDFDVPLRFGYKTGRHLGAMKDVNKKRLKRVPKTVEDYQEIVAMTMQEAA